MEAIVKLQKNKNITLPTWLIKMFHVGIGDYIKIEQTDKGIFLKPAKLVDASQSYFWTKEWQVGEQEAQMDIKKKRVKKFKNAKDLLNDLKK